MADDYVCVCVHICVYVYTYLDHTYNNIHSPCTQAYNAHIQHKCLDKMTISRKYREHHHHATIAHTHANKGIISMQTQANHHAIKSNRVYLHEHQDEMAVLGKAHHFSEDIDE